MLKIYTQNATLLLLPGPDVLAGLLGRMLGPTLLTELRQSVFNTHHTSKAFKIVARLTLKIIAILFVLSFKELIL